MQLLQTKRVLIALILRVSFSGFYDVYLETVPAENVKRKVRRGKSNSFQKLQINGFLTKTATCKKSKT